MNMKLLATVTFAFAAVQSNAQQPTEAPTMNVPTTPSSPVAVTASPIPLPVFNNAQEAIDWASLEIGMQVGNDTRIGYKYVRLAFHDCVGGVCDGCVDMTDFANKGLEVPMDALAFIIQACTAVPGITRADIFALAGLRSAEILSTPHLPFPFKWIGRRTCEMRSQIDHCPVSCSERAGPTRFLPSPNLDTHGVLQFFFNNFGFNAEQTVAIMGAHSIGLVDPANSGFVGNGWSSTPSMLNNAYYKNLVGVLPTISSQVKGCPKWEKATIDNSNNPGFPDRHQWNFNGLFMTNADIAMARNFTGKQNVVTKEVICDFRGSHRCPLAHDTITFMQAYRNDNDLWLQDFRDVFTFMVEFPYNPTIPCAQLCPIPP